jgi:hypothetical protein
MFVSLSEIDLVQFLNLDKTLSPGEIDTLLDSLTKEIFFRLLHEKLPKLLSKNNFKYLSDKYRLSDDIDELMDEINKTWPDVNIGYHMKEAATQVKKEFINNYLKDMKKDFDDESINRNIDQFLTEISKPMIDIDLCQILRDEIGKRINKINVK